MSSIPRTHEYISEAKIGNPFSIQPEAWKLLVETFGRPALQQYLDKRKFLEQNDLEKTSKGPPKPVLNDGVQPNHHTPPTTSTRYPNKNAMANATLLQGTEETDSTDEDVITNDELCHHSKLFVLTDSSILLGRSIPALQKFQLP